MHATLSDIIVDLVQNSIEADSSQIDIVFTETEKDYQFSIQDNGKGMDKDTLKKASDPFWTDGIKHPNRRFGLGIPFLHQTAQLCGGSAKVSSEPGKGTKVKATFPISHVDLPPTGDMILLWVQCLTFGDGYGMTIRRNLRVSEGKNHSYSMDRDEVSSALSGFEDARSIGLLKDYIFSLENSISEESKEQGAFNE